MAALRDFVLLYIFFVYMTSKATEGFTAEFVFDALSRRLTDVFQEIETVKSDIADLKLDVKRIEEKVEKMENNMSNIGKLADDKDNGRSKSVMTDSIKRQSKVIQKMFASLKVNWKERAGQFQNKFSEFQSDIKSQLLLMNTSVGKSIEKLERTVTDYKTATNATLVLMNSQLETKVNETENRVEEIGKEVKEINETGQSIKAEFKSDIESAENMLTSRLTSEISTVTTRLEALETKQVTNGGWDSWASWTSCDASCGGGMRYRKRHCNSPTPVGGKFCDGSPFDVQLCNQNQCPGRKASFSVRSGASRGDDGIVRFSTVDLNEGSVFDKTTGVFTCPFPGLYVFVGTIIEQGSGDNRLFCSIRRNGSGNVMMVSQPGKTGDRRAVDGRVTATGAVSLRLGEGEQIDLYCSSWTGTNIYASSFTGFLVNSDP